MKHVPYDHELYDSLDANLHALKLALHQSPELVVRELNIMAEDRRPGGRIAVIFLDGLTDRTLIHEHILFPLLSLRLDAVTPEVIAQQISVAAISRERSLDRFIESLIRGSTLIMIDGHAIGLVVSTEGWEHRPIGGPAVETSILGPQDSFVEVLRINTALLRRRIKDPSLVVFPLRLGERSKTDLSLIYLADIANPVIVDEVKRRLATFDSDMLLDSSTLAEILEDQPFSPFPQVSHTQRIDRLTAAVMEGRVAILVDGTPFSIYMPVTFSEMLFFTEDYYMKFYFGTFIRWIRILAVLIALLLPSIYIAVSTFHQEMVPTELMLMMAANRTGIPFPTLIEAFLMEVTFELLREASIRMPGAFGQPIGIVGALVIGQAAVQANIIGPVLTVIVSFTAIGSFIVPSYGTSLAVRLLRFPMMILAGTMGLFGIIFGISLILIHLVRLKSFGVEYMGPLTPDTLSQIDDSLVLKKPNFLQWKRPGFLRPLDRSRGSRKY